MTFSEALVLLKFGKKIKRANWGGYWFIRNSVVVDNDFINQDKDMNFVKIKHLKIDEMIVAKLIDGTYAPAQAYQNDLLANDWEVIE